MFLRLTCPLGPLLLVARGCRAQWALSADRQLFVYALVVMPAQVHLMYAEAVMRAQVHGSNR